MCRPLKSLDNWICDQYPQTPKTKTWIQTNNKEINHLRLGSEINMKLEEFLVRRRDKAGFVMKRVAFAIRPLERIYRRRFWRSWTDFNLVKSGLCPINFREDLSYFGGSISREYIFCEIAVRARMSFVGIEPFQLGLLLVELCRILNWFSVCFSGRWARPIRYWVVQFLPSISWGINLTNYLFFEFNETSRQNLRYI